MLFTKEELQNLSLASLRCLAREVGVKSPCSKKKEILIEEIVLVKTGKVEPYFSNKGRNALNSLLLDKKDFPLELKALLEKRAKEFVEEIVGLVANFNQ